jgi:hypothetical protein
MTMSTYVVIRKHVGGWDHLAGIAPFRYHLECRSERTGEETFIPWPWIAELVSNAGGSVVDG